MIYLSPVTFDFGAPADYYVNEDYLAQKSLVKQYGIKLLKLYGYDKTKVREVSKSITDYYTEIFKKSKMSNNFNDDMYNIITKEDMAENIISRLFQYDIDRIYTEKYLNNKSKEYVETMIDDILKYYEKILVILTG